MAAVPDLFPMAMEYHRAGDLQQAEMLYRHILQSNPRHGEALHLLGVLCHQVGRSELAVEHISDALSMLPNFAEGHNNLANVLVALDRHDEAEKHSREAIRLKPEFADPYNNLGIILRHRGKLDEAIANYYHALKLQPNSAFAYNNLGNALREQGKPEEALRCYDYALRLNPDFAEAHNNRGTAFQDLGKPEQALVCFREALRRRPNYPDALNNLGVVLAGANNHDEARQCYEQALRLMPHFVSARRNLGLLLHSRGLHDEAIAHFREVLRLKPDDPTANHLLAALQGDRLPDKPSAAYVTELFDGYAGHFDDHLVKVLNYRGPSLLRDALAQLGKPKALDILDLGCGTGLCGVELRGWARKLSGVDLSPKMLARAKQRGIYDELIQGDIGDSLKSAKAAYDLIVAGDVFTYLGDLSEIIHAAKKALRSGGHLAFWVECHDADDVGDAGGPGFHLRTSGRYAHSAEYLRGLARATGLTEISMTKAVSRTDGGKDIESLVVVFRAA